MHTGGRLSPGSHRSTVHIAFVVHIQTEMDAYFVLGEYLSIELLSISYMLEGAVKVASTVVGQR